MNSAATDRSGGGRSGVRQVVIVFGVYAALALVCTWPLATDFRTHIANDPWDPLLNAAILWWNATTVPFSSEWWNAPHYYPSEGVSAFTENLVGILPISGPVLWISGNPIAAYNITFFLTWPLSALAAFLLVRLVSKRADAAFLAGLAFGFSPYRTTELAHLQSLTSYGLPLVLLAMHGFADDGRSRWLWLFGASWLLQSLSNGYFMLFGAVLIVVWLLYFCSRRDQWRTARTLIATWALVSLPLAAVMFQYEVIHDRVGLGRTENEILAYSAIPKSWAEVSGDVWFWRAILPQGKDDLFPGATVLVLLLAAAMAISIEMLKSRSGERAWMRWLGRALFAIAFLSVCATVVTLCAGPWSVTVAGVQLFRMNNLNRALPLILGCGLSMIWISPFARDPLRRRSPFVFYVSATFVFALLCCGPVLRAGGGTILEPAPYRFLMLLPGFDGLRVPTRLWMVGTLCLSVAAALAFARLRQTWPARGTALLASAAAGLLLDGVMPGMRMATPPDRWTDVETPGRAEPILELPIGPDFDYPATYRAAGHRRRVVNGVSGYDPPHYFALKTGLDRRDPAMLPAIASLGTFDVVVDADPPSDLSRYVSQTPGAVRAGGDGHRALFRIPQGPPEPELGEVLPIVFVQASSQDARAIHDGRIATGWGDIPQRPGQWVTADLGQVRLVGGVTHAIGEYLLDFPRRLAIELSTEGQTWSRVWEGSTAANTFLAYVRAPREAPLRFAFSPGPARFVRLMQLDTDRSMWRISELTVHAPRAAADDRRLR